MSHYIKTQTESTDLFTVNLFFEAGETFQDKDLPTASLTRPDKKELPYAQKVIYYD